MFGTRTSASLKSRLLAAQAAIFLATLAAFVGFYLALEQGDMRFHVIDDLYDVTEDLGKALVAGPNGTIILSPPQSLAEQIAAYRDPAYGAVELSSGNAVPGSHPSLPPAALPGGSDVLEAWFRYVDTAGVSRNGVCRQITAQGRRFKVYFLPTETEFGLSAQGLADELSSEILPVFVPMAIAGLILTALTLNYTLRPLARASRDALAVALDTPGRRLSTDGLPSEILPLVDAVNRAIGRLEAGLEQQRRFSANTAHQLRTPLAILQTRIDALPPSEVRTDLAQDVDRMSRLVAQLLTSTRLEAGQVTEFRTVDITDLLRDIIADMAPLAHRRGRDFELDAPDPVVATISPSALEEAVRNLLENALRHTPPGTMVTVRARPGAIIEVCDRGPGIPPEMREQIFERFWSGPQTQGGAGLGLAIVRDAANLLGGDVSVHDAAGGGALFRLTLPQRGRQTSE